MNSINEIPHEGKTQNDARARLAAVRTSWYGWQTRTLHAIAVVVVVAWFFMPGSAALGTWLRPTFIVVLLILQTLNYHLRDKAWRQLIKHEAPELYRRIEPTDA